MNQTKESRLNVKKNDTVMVMAGDERGKTGKVLRVMKKKDGVVVEKLNFVKRHVKPGHPTAPQGGVIEKEAPIKISKVLVVCPKCNKPTRVGHSRGDGKHYRVCRQCGDHID
jgi:large subunit ribosomal protein L24